MIGAQAQSTSLSGLAGGRGGSAGRKQCGLQRLLKNARREQKQQQQQREMIKQQRAGGEHLGLSL